MLHRLSYVGSASNNHVCWIASNEWGCHVAACLTNFALRGGSTCLRSATGIVNELNCCFKLHLATSDFHSNTFSILLFDWFSTLLFRQNHNQWWIQDFPERWRQLLRGMQNLLFCKFAPENCMKIKEFWPRGANPWCLPLDPPLIIMTIIC